MLRFEHRIVLQCNQTLRGRNGLIDADDTKKQTIKNKTGLEDLGHQTGFERYGHTIEIVYTFTMPNIHRYKYILYIYMYNGSI